MSNDKVILDEVLTQNKSEIAPDMSESSFFELFSAEQVLKNFDLSYEEIKGGLTGGGNDGGVDSVYLFVDTDLVNSDEDIENIIGKKSMIVNIVLIQSKITSGFSEVAIKNLTASAIDLFNLGRKDVELRTAYNEQILETTGHFLRVCKKFAKFFPIYKFDYHFVTKASENPNPNVVRQIDNLKDVIDRSFGGAGFAFTFWGAAEVLESARRTPSKVYQLNLAENPISSRSEGFVCLVNLIDYYRFISTNDSHLNKHIFESNVRDYQGSNEVNEKIHETLQETNAEDFWWLNNGVTLLANKASLSGKTLTIEDPQVVNGLQTSNEIWRYYKDSGNPHDHRNVLVRVIVLSSPDSRDRIIRATNSQTRIPDASLRATEKIHHDIEEYFKHRTFFYDRRKNFYKNEGRPVERIISIASLAQAVMAIALQRPDDARARPSSLLKRQDDYKRVFSNKYPIGMYYNCLQVMKRTDAYLKSDEAQLRIEDRNNLRYYVGMYATMLAIDKNRLTFGDIAVLDLDKVNQACLSRSLTVVIQAYGRLGGNDQVAKGKDLIKSLLDMPK